MALISEKQIEKTTNILMVLFVLSLFAGVFLFSSGVHMPKFTLFDWLKSNTGRLFAEGHVTPKLFLFCAVLVFSIGCFDIRFFDNLTQSSATNRNRDQLLYG
jgi:hypothetical protein